MEHGHQEALREVVQVLPHRQHVVALTPRGVVDPTTLHAATVAADRGYVTAEVQRALHDVCNNDKYVAALIACGAWLQQLQIKATLMPTFNAHSMMSNNAD